MDRPLRERAARQSVRKFSWGALLFCGSRENEPPEAVHRTNGFRCDDTEKGKEIDLRASLWSTTLRWEEAISK